MQFLSKIDYPSLGNWPGFGLGVKRLCCHFNRWVFILNIVGPHKAIW